MKTRIVTVSATIAAALCLCSFAARASEKVIVFTPEAVNVEPAVAQAVSATLAAEIESRGYSVAIHRGAKSVVDEQRYTSVPEPPPPPPPPAAEPVPTSASPSSPDEFPAVEPVPVPPAPVAEPSAPAPAPAPLTQDEMESKIAGDMGASYYFTGTLVRLGKQMQLSLAMKKADGQVVANKKMAARTEDDLPIVITRITEALLQQKSVEETRNLDNATRAETQNLPQRFRLEKNFGAILGHAFGLGDMHSFTQISFDGRFEFNDIIAEIDAGMGVGNEGLDEMQFIFDIAMSYYLVHKHISPYIGAGFGIFLGNRLEVDEEYDEEEDVWLDNSDTPRVGWNLFPVVGLEFLRHSAIRVHVDFRYLFNFSGEAFGHAPMILAGVNF